METKQLKVWGGTVLTVPNGHYECCGKPPELQAKDNCYTAYFENDYGEQIVFQYHYKTKKGTLWHGDFGWDTPVEVMGGGTTMIMNEGEREWLRLVWRVATRHESKEFQLRSALDLVNAHITIYDELLARPEFVGDTPTQRGFGKVKKKLEKQKEDLTDQLIEVQVEDAAKEQDEKGLP